MLQQDVRVSLESFLHASHSFPELIINQMEERLKLTSHRDSADFSTMKKELRAALIDAVGDIASIGTQVGQAGVPLKSTEPDKGGKVETSSKTDPVASGEPSRASERSVKTTGKGALSKGPPLEKLFSSKEPKDGATPMSTDEDEGVERRRKQLAARRASKAEHRSHPHPIVQASNPAETYAKPDVPSHDTVANLREKVLAQHEAPGGQAKVYDAPHMAISELTEKLRHGQSYDLPRPKTDFRRAMTVAQLADKLGGIITRTRAGGEPLQGNDMPTPQQTPIVSLHVREHTKL